MAGERLNIQAEPRTFLEIGPGYNPVIKGVLDYSEAAEAFRGVNYICVDNNSIDPHFKNTYSRYTHELNSVGFHGATFENMTLPPESIDEIYMANVFGEYLWRQRERGISWDIGHEFSDIAGHLPKVLNLLKRGGLFTIVETTTPPEPDSLINDLTESGFRIDEIIYSSDKDWLRLQRMYYLGQRTNHLGFLVRAHKQEE